MVGKIAFCCDSTILILLTGNTANKVFVTRLLAISQRLQLEGESLNAFNLAAAKAQHKEILEAWLYTVSEAHTSIEVAANYSQEYSRLLIEVANDLGLVRKKLAANSLELIHEIIEVCITKISLIGAIVSEQTRVYEFLKLELRVFEPRRFAGDGKLFVEKLDLGDFEEKMGQMLDKTSEKQMNISSQLFEKLVRFKNGLDGDAIPEVRWLASYSELVDTFILLKKQILEDGVLEAKKLKIHEAEE